MIVISSEMQELIGLCHRILVMRDGRIVGEVAGEAMTEAEPSWCWRPASARRRDVARPCGDALT